MTHNKQFFKDLGLEEWKYPSSYMGYDYEGYYILHSIVRDDNIINESNHNTIIKKFEDKNIPVDYSYNPKEYTHKRHPRIISVSFSHFACGYIETIMVYKNINQDIKDILTDIIASLSDYPILDDNDYYARESETIQESYDNYIEQDLMNLIKTKLNLYDIEPKENIHTRSYLDDLMNEMGNTEYIVEGTSVSVYNFEKLSDYIKKEEVVKYFNIDEIEESDNTL